MYVIRFTTWFVIGSFSFPLVDLLTGGIFVRMDRHTAFLNLENAIVLAVIIWTLILICWALRHIGRYAARLLNWVIRKSSID